MDVLLDTSIYRKDPKRTTAGFLAINRLAAAKRIHLHMPYFVLNEFLTQQTDRLSAEFDKMLKAGGNVTRLTDHEATVAAVAQILDKIEGQAKKVVANVTGELDEWIAATHTKVHAVDDSHGRRVAEAYFSGTPPFSSIKQRSDFPDSFIYETARDLAEKHEHLHVIVADNTLRTACDGINNVMTYASVEEFVGSPECQDLLLVLDEVLNVDRLMKLLPEETNVLQGKLEHEIINPLASTMFSDQSIPDDNNEATVQGVGQPRETKFSFGDAEYYGDGMVVIPFSAIVECQVYYFIYKGDWYSMSDEAAEDIGISDLNEHYFEAEDTRDLSVDGRLVLGMPVEELQRDDLSDEDLTVLITDCDTTVEIEDVTVHHTSPY